VNLKETRLPGVYLIEPRRRSDERGFFARTFCSRELAELGLETRIAQSSISFNPTRGTLRGMHYQASPHGETKIIRCTMGAIWDCLIDLRPDSPTYKQWVAERLTAENRKLFYVPEGIAHGFLTLEPDSEVFYEISSFFVPDAARGVRWDDPTFAVDWPIRPRLMSDRDRDYVDFE
jgi:dTDP-4-dehydrorhamnose 3,5-epimerase